MKGIDSIIIINPGSSEFFSQNYATRADVKKHFNASNFLQTAPSGSTLQLHSAPPRRENKFHTLIQ
jgi:hypothetical protein